MFCTRFISYLSQVNSFCLQNLQLIEVHRKSSCKNLSRHAKLEKCLNFDLHLRTVKTLLGIFNTQLMVCQSMPLVTGSHILHFYFLQLNMETLDVEKRHSCWPPMSTLQEYYLVRTVPNWYTGLRIVDRI